MAEHVSLCAKMRLPPRLWGINTTVYKVAAFTIGAFFAGLAGVLYAHAFFIISPQSFGFLRSVETLIIVVLGGMGSLTGSVLAAVLLTFLSMVLAPWPYQRMIIYSLALILMMVFRPSGLMGSKEFDLPSLVLPKKEGGGLAVLLETAQACHDLWRSACRI